MKLSTALRLGRVSNLPTVATNVLAACVLSGAPFSWAVYGGLSAAMALAYVGGMYLNDAFDRDFDARVRPERPIPSGEVTARQVLVLGFAMLGLSVWCVGVVVWRGAGGALLPAISSMLALSGTIVFYDLYHKQNPLSPVVMGACRVLVYVTSALVIAPFPHGLVFWGATALLGYLVGLSYAAKQENLGEVKNLWPLALIALPLASVVLIRDAAGALFLLLFAAWAGYALSWLLRKQGRNIPRAVGYFIAGISLLDGALTGLAGQPWLALACVIGFFLTLALQSVVPGT
jgi:4-hydroxybenzoate polyprenyltransferase